MTTYNRSGFDRLIPTKEAAYLLGYKHASSLWRLVAQDKLDAPLKLSPRRAVWPESSLVKFIEERKKER